MRRASAAGSGPRPVPAGAAMLPGPHRLPRPPRARSPRRPSSPRPTSPRATSSICHVPGRPRGHGHGARSTSGSWPSRTPSRAASTSTSTRSCSSTTCSSSARSCSASTSTCSAPPALRLDDVRNVVVASRWRWPSAAASSPSTCRAPPRSPPPPPPSAARARSADGQATRARRPSAPALAAKLYDLEVIAEDIEDHPDNATRFVLVRPARRRHPGPDRPRQDVDRLLPAAERAGLAPRHPRPVLGPGHRPHPLESRPDQAGPRRLLLPHRPRRPHRRRAGRRLPARPPRRASPT